ncbi:unnamed protein product [Cuscuta europaea]|uniref:NAC domain-containing protein n=1 Tax=Cuscuta europaea TaxID=41803 RepID=A0A9P1E810_CUSEU|nr:unnamed protein product [Cuscuta europaea]
MVLIGEGPTDQRLPPGFRFHPTDEELVLYYLKRKVCRRRLLLDVIGETDVYKWDPEDLPELSKLKTGDRQWFFFSPRDRKHPNSSRTNRATEHGYWKVTGKDRTITCNSRDVGIKKTLVFYKGRAPKGERTDWVMHEYTLDEEELRRCQSSQDYYVLYKVFKKSGPGPKIGEEYGAPFKEEDWADDECLQAVTIHVEQDKSPEKVNDDGLPVVDELEELLNRLAGEPPLTELNYLTENTSSDMTHSGALKTLLPEVTVGPVTNEGGKAQVVEEVFLEDSLEVNDLDGLRPTGVQSMAIQPFVSLDGYNELDIYQDACMFLHDMGATGKDRVSGRSVFHVTNDITSSHFTNSGDFHPMEINPQLHINAGNNFNNQPWSHELSCGMINSIEVKQCTILPMTSGVVYGTHLESHPVSANLTQNTTTTTQGDTTTTTTQDDASKHSSFSSALWAFMESIPTTHASAAESDPASKAFELGPSFQRLGLNAINIAAAVSNASAVSERCCAVSCNNGFCRLFCFSLLGVCCAILWMIFVAAS